ncbi:MAG TPA: PilZ domain-containing protein [Pyrinomonadaceae bacterium]|nr:PilZ domain-containing protein [Pyrinomonadaceae bacterium]
MAQIEYATSSYKTPLHHRILANMPVKVSWTDGETGKRISVTGTTENIGESSALVNLEVLPPVGSEVRLRVMEEDKAIIDVTTRVIRVERDPSKPLAALSVLQNLKKWKTTAMEAAERWVTRHWQLNYEEEWVN